MKTNAPVVMLLIVLLMVLVAYFVWLDGSITRQSASTTNSTTGVATHSGGTYVRPSSSTAYISATSTIPTSNAINWLTYSNPSLGFSIKYPQRATYSVDANTPISATNPQIMGTVVTFDLSSASGDSTPNPLPPNGGSEWFDFTIAATPDNGSSLSEWVYDGETGSMVPSPAIQEQITANGEPMEYVAYPADDGFEFGVGYYVPVAIYFVDGAMKYRISGMAIPDILAPQLKQDPSLPAAVTYESIFLGMLHSITFTDANTSVQQ